MTTYFPSSVEEGDNVRLLEEVSKDKLQKVMHSFQKDKSHGPDGWSIEFFLGFYEIIEDNLMRFIEESQSSWKRIDIFNTTFIALIPKSYNPESYEEYRPISLCNCICKIIAKIIALKVKKLLSESISKEQSGFLLGRQIHETTGLAQEGHHTMKAEKLKAMLV
jgi:hypothetical protein